MQDTPTLGAEQGPWFTTTHWSLVLNAQDPASPQAGEALEQLCRAYWYPLYAFARRLGHDDPTAKDLTQGFFASLIARNYLADVRREKGKFRSFLLAAFKHSIADDRDKARAQKRGGGQIAISLDAPSVEDRYRHEPAEVLDPETLYERSWVLTLLDETRERLRQECCAADKTALYEHWQHAESGDEDAPSHAEAAPRLGLSEGGLRTAVFRLRQRYRELLRAEVAQTVNSPAEVDEELRYLLRVISG